MPKYQQQIVGRHNKKNPRSLRVVEGKAPIAFANQDRGAPKHNTQFS